MRIVRLNMINQELICSAREHDYEVSDDLRKYTSFRIFIFSHILKQLKISKPVQLIFTKFMLFLGNQLQYLMKLKDEDRSFIVANVTNS